MPITRRDVNVMARGTVKTAGITNFKTSLRRIYTSCRNDPQALTFHLSEVVSGFSRETPQLQAGRYLGREENCGSECGKCRQDCGIL